MQQRIHYHEGIAEEEKTQIKQHLTNLMLASPKHVQLQLSEALTIIW